MNKVKITDKKKSSSKDWLRRHLNDEYYLKSKKDGYRSRASYKLIQIEEKFKVIKKSQSVLDLGSAPGGWVQVIRKISKKNALILGIDLLKIERIEGIKFFQADIFDDDILEKINFFFKNKKIDLILSDMSPNTSGNKTVDHLRIVNLVEKVLNLAGKILRPGGSLITKVFQGGAQGQLLTLMKNELSYIKYFKPKASRQESPETYLFGIKK